MCILHMYLEHDRPTRRQDPTPETTARPHKSRHIKKTMDAQTCTFMHNIIAPEFCCCPSTKKRTQFQNILSGTILYQPFVHLFLLPGHDALHDTRGSEHPSGQHRKRRNHRVGKCHFVKDTLSSRLGLAHWAFVRKEWTILQPMISKLVHGRIHVFPCFKSL